MCVFKGFCTGSSVFSAHQNVDQSWASHDNQTVFQRVVFEDLRGFVLEKDVIDPLVDSRLFQ